MQNNNVLGEAPSKEGGLRAVYDALAQALHVIYLSKPRALLDIVASPSLGRGKRRQYAAFDRPVVICGPSLNTRKREWMRGGSSLCETADSLEFALRRRRLSKR